MRSSSNRWKGSIVDGISDISPSDAKCIDILIDYLADREAFELAAILSAWKKDKDSDFIDKLIKYTKYEEKGEEREKKVEEEGGLGLGLDEFLSIEYIDFCGLLFDTRQIDVISTGDDWSETKMRSIFYIEINPKRYSSRKLTVRKEFVLEEHRDNELDELKEKLENCGINFI